MALLTSKKQKQLASSELHDILRSKGVDLDEDGLGEHLESWRQTMLKLVEENARQAKKIKELEKRVAKKQEKK